MTNKSNYSEYTVCVGNDESNYGSDCTCEQAMQIAGKLQALIEAEFPGITVRRVEEIGIPRPTLGPDLSVCGEIGSWIAENWTAVL